MAKILAGKGAFIHFKITKILSIDPTSNGASCYPWWFQTTNNCIQGHNKIVQRLGSHTSRGRYLAPIPPLFLSWKYPCSHSFRIPSEANGSSGYRSLVTEPSPSRLELIVGPMKNGVNLFSRRYRIKRTTDRKAGSEPENSQHSIWLIGKTDDLLLTSLISHIHPTLHITP
jgi:hypothetical protein